jgi:hypothetical protein
MAEVSLIRGKCFARHHLSMMPHFHGGEELVRCFLSEQWTHYAYGDGGNPVLDEVLDEVYSNHALVDVCRSPMPKSDSL